MSQTCFGILSGFVESSFAPKAIVFDLSGTASNGAYPKVTLRVHRPGAAGNWEDLEVVPVNDEVQKQYPLENSKPGRYAFRVIYNATEPPVDARPALFVKAVELVE